MLGNNFLFFEGEKHGKQDENEGNDVVPAESFGLENGDDDDGEHGQGNRFLNDFQLDKVERTSVLHGSDAVGRNHERVFEQGYAPRHEDDQKERPILWGGDDFEQLELAIPSESHEDIGNDEEKDGINTFHDDAIFRLQK